MKKENKKAQSRAAAPASQLRPPAMGRVDVKVFRDALAQRAVRKQQENRAFAQQLAARIARTTSARTVSNSIASRRRPPKPRDVSG